MPAEDPILSSTHSQTTSPTLQFRPKFDFQDVDTDIILKSSDGVQFRTYKCLLSLASAVFKNMFATANTGGGIQVVDMNEDARSLELMISLCDPRAFTVLEGLSVEEIYYALGIADKYQMQSLSSVALLLEGLRPHIPLTPLRVYAVACNSISSNQMKNKATDIAKAAAKELLKHPIPFSDEEAKSLEVRNLRGQYLYPLYDWHVKCGEEISAHVLLCRDASPANIPELRRFWEVLASKLKSTPLAPVFDEHVTDSIDGLTLSDQATGHAPTFAAMIWRL